MFLIWTNKFEQKIARVGATLSVRKVPDDILAKMQILILKNQRLLSISLWVKIKLRFGMFIDFLGFYNFSKYRFTKPASWASEMDSMLAT